MLTFTEAVAHATSPEEIALAEVKKSFTATHAKLCEQLRGYQQKQKPALLSRVSTVQARQQAAAAKGIRHSRVEHLLERLCGGRSAVDPGAIQGTEHTLIENIRLIEGLSLRDLPQRHWWLTWYAFPENFRNNLNGIAQFLDELEGLVQDGGELHRMVEEKHRKEG